MIDHHHHHGNIFVWNLTPQTYTYIVKLTFDGVKRKINN